MGWLLLGETREGCLGEEAGSDGDSRALSIGPCCAQFFTRPEQERAFWEQDASPARVRVSASGVARRGS